jgi:DUF2946 family protein
MSLGVIYRHRRLGVTLALIGVAFYAVLFPWHIVSQTLLQFDRTALGLAATAPCHERSAEAQGAPSSNSEPAKSRTHCPICSGLASLQTALAGAPEVVIPAREPTCSGSPGLDESLAKAASPTPLSRGPPSLCA